VYSNSTPIVDPAVKQNLERGLSEARALSSTCQEKLDAVSAEEGKIQKEYPQLKTKLVSDSIICC
jgi:hypothetical protein